MNRPKVDTPPGNRTWDLMIARPTLYFTITDTTGGHKDGTRLSEDSKIKATSTSHNKLILFIKT